MLIVLRSSGIELNFVRWLLGAPKIGERVKFHKSGQLNVKIKEKGVEHR